MAEHRRRPTGVATLESALAKHAQRGAQGTSQRTQPHYPKPRYQRYQRPRRVYTKALASSESTDVHPRTQGRHCELMKPHCWKTEGENNVRSDPAGCPNTGLHSADSAQAQRDGVVGDEHCRARAKGWRRRGTVSWLEAWSSRAPRRSPRPDSEPQAEGHSCMPRRPNRTGRCHVTAHATKTARGPQPRLPRAPAT